MNLETIITLIAILGTYVVLVGCIWGLMKQVATLHRLLVETTREYKLYQAAVDEDYKTVGVLRNTFAGVKNKPVAFEVDSVPEQKEAESPPGAVLTQRG